MTSTVTFSDGRTRNLDRLEELTVRLYRGEHGFEPYTNDVHPEWWEAIKQQSEVTGESFASISDTLWSWAIKFHDRVTLVQS